MTYAAGDHRKCMAEVRDMMKQKAAQRQFPSTKREKQYIQNVYLFGHYDSRGGAALVHCPNLPSAMVMYAAKMHFNVEDEADIWALGEEDWMDKRDVVVLDKKLDILHDRELLAGFCDKGGYKAAEVEYELLIKGKPLDLPEDQRWRVDDRLLFLYTGKLPPPMKTTAVGYRFVENDTLGEDAWGVIWLAYDTPLTVNVLRSKEKK